MKIEEVIKKRGKEEFYNFYLGLGYDKKTAAALALFTYGQYSFGRFSMDELYEALCKGEEYLPPEELERRRIQKERIKRSRRIMGLRKAIFSDGEIDGAHLPESTKAMPAPAISAPTVPPQPLSTMPESPMRAGRLCFRANGFGSQRGCFRNVAEYAAFSSVNHAISRSAKSGNRSG